MKRVVIVGAGFAGLSAMEALQGKGYSITLIDRHNFATFQPLLYQVATAGLNPGDVAFPVRTLLRHRQNVKFRQGIVEKIDTEAQRAILADGVSLPYDYLILAVGATTNYFGVPGAAQNCKAIYTLDEAIEVRNRVFAMFEWVAAHGMKDYNLTTVVVGGGATGVEMAGALAELKSRALSTDYPTLDPDAARVVLIEAQDRLLGAFSPSLSRYALRELKSRGVEVKLNTAVKSVTETGVELGDGEFIESNLIVWGAGVGVSEEVRSMGLPHLRNGRIEVEPDLRVKGYANIFAAGDVAGTMGPGDKLIPQLAQPAIQTGQHAAMMIKAIEAEEETKPFRYKDKGTMATIGRRAAVAELGGGIKLTGSSAWFAWLALHVMTLLGVRNRLSVLLNWSWHYVSWGRGPRVILGG